MCGRGFPGATLRRIGTRVVFRILLKFAAAALGILDNLNRLACLGYCKLALAVLNSWSHEALCCLDRVSNNCFVLVRLLQWLVIRVFLQRLRQPFDGLPLLGLSLAD